MKEGDKVSYQVNPVGEATATGQVRFVASSLVAIRPDQPEVFGPLVVRRLEGQHLVVPEHKAAPAA